MRDLVRKALEAAGLNTGGHPVYAKDWGPTLVRLGFSVVPEQGYQPKLGDIVVMQSTTASISGHIEGFDGKNWVSDFVQSAFCRGPASARKSRITRFIVGLSSLLFITGALAASTGPNVVEPVFGLSYDPAAVDFEPASSDLVARCPELVNARWACKLWVYGQAGAPGDRIRIVGGFYVAQPPAPPRPETDPKGAVVEITDTKCALLGSAGEVLQYPEGLIAPTVLDALVADVVERYRAAFGGAAALQRKLRDSHVNLTGPRDARLRDALSSAADTQ